MNIASTTPSPNPDHATSDPDSTDRLQDLINQDSPDPSSPSRSRSVLNLTASTLFGIYAPTGDESIRDETPTPWGTGTQTPASIDSVDAMRRDLASMFRSQVPAGSQSPRSDNEADRKVPDNRPRMAPRRSSVHAFQSSFVPISTRLIALFAFGVAYGLVVSKLHENSYVTPVQVEGIERGWIYLAFWGMAGVGLGSLLPWVDWVWARDGEDGVVEDTIESRRGRAPRDTVTGRGELARGRRGNRESVSQRINQSPSVLGTDWSLVVRSVGAFVGIAFAIRKTPWQSTLQLSLTLALVNPVLWYILDRSKPGFVISAIVGLTGTAVLLAVNPDVVPSPAPHSRHPSFSSALSHALNRTKTAPANGPIANGSALRPDGVFAGLTSAESVGVATWIASVLFCSSICFGNIGRKLALKGPKDGHA
ncbi:MAG: hypothetical protein Q9157_008494 [Trypethelium eluteriae]